MIGTKNAGNKPRQVLGATMEEPAIKERGSWLSLVMVCAVTVLSASVGFGVLFAGASGLFSIAESSSLSASEVSPSKAAQVFSDQVSDEQVPDGQPAQTVAAPPQQPSTPNESSGASSRAFNGMITDSRCGARHSRNSGKTSAECARSCVRKGSRYVLVDGEEVHGLEGDPTQLVKLAGVRVEVVGLLEGDTIKVKSVAVR